jgi:hypothetical protein
MSGRREFPDDHEPPWTEEEWLADMMRNDARADRFGELLETLKDAPDRDENIAREMGWDDMADALAAEQHGEHDDDQDVDGQDALLDGDDDDDDDGDDGDDEAFDTDSDFEDLEEHREPEPEMVRHPDPEKLLASVPEADQEREESAREENLFGRQPARQIAEYQFAHRIGIKLHWALRPYSSGDADEDPTDGLLGQARIGPHIASAKIVGGHSLGYSKHYINGNIACQRIGLDAVDKSIKAYDLLVNEGHVPEQFVDRIMPDLNRLREVLAARIERLRAYARTLHR